MPALFGTGVSPHVAKLCAGLWLVQEKANKEAAAAKAAGAKDPLAATAAPQRHEVSSSSNRPVEPCCCRCSSALVLFNKQERHTKCPEHCTDAGSSNALLRALCMPLSVGSWRCSHSRRELDSRRLNAACDMQHVLAPCCWCHWCCRISHPCLLRVRSCSARRADGTSPCRSLRTGACWVLLLVVGSVIAALRAGSPKLGALWECEGII